MLLCFRDFLRKNTEIIVDIDETLWYSFRAALKG